MNLLKMDQLIKISGIIQSGAGKGAYFIRLDWVVKQCKELLGYEPFPGTLNVSVEDEDLPVLDMFLQDADLKLIPDDPAFCTAGLKKVRINQIPASVVVPAEDVRIHANRVMELIAPCNLKDALGLHDGDRITFCSDQENGKRP